MHPYAYAPTDPQFDIRLIASTSQRLHYEVIFAIPRSIAREEGNTVYGEYFVPQNANQIPLVILVPGFGDESVAPCLTLARIIVKQGVASFVLYLPLHSKHLPYSVKKGFIPSSPEEWLGIYQVSVLGIRQIVEWASRRQELDLKRIGVAGFSMGGMISSIAMALDKRIYAGVFIVTGGNMEELSWGRVRDALPVGHNCTRDECHNVYSQYPAFMDNVKENGIEKAVPAKECFLFDPLTFAGHLRGRRMMMVNGEQDDIVPRRAALEFWKACDEPPLIWLPANHVSIYSHIQLIGQKIVDQLK